MSRFLIVFLTIILSVALISCKSEQKTEEIQMQDQEQVTTAVSDTTQVTCPSCGMTHAMAEMTAYEIDGETYYFCSESCRDSYIAQLEAAEETEESDIQD